MGAKHTFANITVSMAEVLCAYRIPPKSKHGLDVMVQVLQGMQLYLYKGADTCIPVPSGSSYTGKKH